MKKGKRKEELIENSKRLFLDALRASLGVINPACAATNISRSCYYLWYKNDPEFKEAVDEINNMSIDFVESAMFEGIRKGNDRLIIFYLTHKARHRGYQAPTQEVVITNQVVEFKFPNLELNEQNDIIVENLLEKKKEDEDDGTI
jgi:hypothetical protein